MISPWEKEERDKLSPLDALDGALVELLAQHVVMRIMNEHKDREEERDE